jgi:CubicO group peptidase (beta-lactamase class C family)
MARGVFGQLIYMSPADSTVVVKLSSWPEFLSAERSINAHAAIDAIAQTLGS